jgi:hypothetical protein
MFISPELEVTKKETITTRYLIYPDASNTVVETLVNIFIV